MKHFLHDWAVWIAAAMSLIFASGCVPTSFSVGGNVTGFASNFSLSLNGAETLNIVKNGGYKFTTGLPAAATYQVVVAAQPAGQACTVTNANGVIANLDISYVNVSCENTAYHVGASVSGLAGKIAVSLNGSDSMTLDADGAYQFATALFNNDSYSVSISTQPAGQQCSVTDSSGNIRLANAHVAITCVITAKAPIITHVWPVTVLGGGEVKVSGSNLDQANVTLAGVAITPTLQTPHELRFIAPENPKGSYTLALENSGGYVSQQIAQGKVLTGLAAVSSGLSHNCVILEDHTVQCWGGNFSGQLGNGGTENAATPVTVGGLSNAIAITTGDNHSCAVLSDNTVRCWGDNRNGQLGDGNTSNSATPRTVSGLSNVAAVSAGSTHSCALLTDNTLSCWGSGFNGELGNDSTTASRTPVVVSGITNAISVSAGYGHSCAMLSDKTVQCWGYNHYGQLGNGNTTNSKTPLIVGGLTNAISVSAGYNHTCALLDNGQAQCWGENIAGQLTLPSVFEIVLGMPVYVR